jgi:hypothetical protein
MEFLFHFVPSKLLVHNSSHTQSKVYIYNKLINYIQNNILHNNIIACGSVWM